MSGVLPGSPWQPVPLSKPQGPLAVTQHGVPMGKFGQNAGVQVPPAAPPAPAPVPELPPPPPEPEAPAPAVPPEDGRRVPASVLGCWLLAGTSSGLEAHEAASAVEPSTTITTASDRL